MTQMHRYRSHTCAQLTTGDVGNNVRLSGWVHRVRDHGGLLFIDLRDHYGITQCVVDPDSPAFAAAEKLRAESVVRIDGEVKLRAEGTANANLPTGGVEVFIRELEVLGAATDLPLPVFGEPDYPEDIRLRYRFLDLRRETLHANIVKRTKVIASMRRRMTEIGFAEYSTPILTASSPEGARDFLVPSRIHPGKFFALPQAPQQYKQLLMVAGFDRYFQIAPCFRDEDPRADRLPGEFYQLDLEMSFVTQEDIWNTMTPVITSIFEEFADGKPVTNDWPRIPYAASVRTFGSDKPDLRNPLIMANVTDVFRGSDFKVFANQIADNESVEVWAIPALGGGSRAFCDRMNAWAQQQGQPGLGYVIFGTQGTPNEFTFDAVANPKLDGESNDEWEARVAKKIGVWSDAVVGRGPIANRIGTDRVELLRKYVGRSHSVWAKLTEGLPNELREKYLSLRPDGFQAGDAVFFVCGIPRSTYSFAGQARNRISDELQLADKNRYELCWVVDFPFYEWNEEEKKLDFAHNPFSMPQGGAAGLVTDKPLEILAYQYDAVCNGFEIASGSIRNQEPETMVAAFEKTGKSKAEVEEQFGGLYRAFQYGAPPHGGAAFGVDRIVMLLCGVQNLREITLFPMNQQAEDLLMGAPSPAEPKQLRELGIRLNLS